MAQFHREEVVHSVRKAFTTFLNFLGELSKTFDQRRHCLNDLNMQLSLPFISSFNQAYTLNSCLKSVPTKEQFNSEKGLFLRSIFTFTLHHLTCCFVCYGRTNRTVMKRNKSRFDFPGSGTVTERRNGGKKWRENEWSPVSCQVITTQSKALNL